MKQDPRVRLHRTASWVLLVALVLTAVLLQARWATQLDHDGENSVDESDSLACLARFTEGQALYRDFRQPPHLITPYMPLFYVLPGTLAHWMHCEGVDVFTVGRCYVYFCWLGIGLWLSILARQAGATQMTASIAAALWLATELSRAHGVSFRPDAPQLFFSLAAFWVYLRGDRWANLLGATALLVLAFLHKQSAIVPLLVLFIAEWQSHRGWRALAMVSTWVAAISGTVLLAQWLTGGVFALNVFQTMATTGNWDRIALVLTLAALRGLPALWGGALGSVTTHNRCHRLWRWYFVLAFGMALTGSWKFGSAPNYYWEPLAAGCVLTALWLTTDAPRHLWLWMGWLAVTLAMTVTSLANRTTQFADWSGALFTHRATRTQEARNWTKLLECLSPIGEPRLIEDPYLAVRWGHSPYLLNASFLTELQRDALFDDAGVLNDISKNRFSAIVTVAPLEDNHRFRHFPPHWLATIGQHYRLAQTCRRDAEHHLYLYIPKPPKDQPSL